MELFGRVESVCGAKTLCVSVKIGEMFFPRYVNLNDIVPRDPNACIQWLSENVIGRDVLLFVARTDRMGWYVADIECEGFDVGQKLIMNGIAD